MKMGRNNTSELIVRHAGMSDLVKTSKQRNLLPNDDFDAELLAQVSLVRRLETRPPPTPARASRRQNLKRVEDSEEEKEEVLL